MVHRNRLIELIQYAPTTETVHETPLLIVPHWINKYYILDMQPKNSMVRYLVEQGFTVFIISWKNPDESMAGITFEDYMDLGPLEASEVVREITGSDTVNVMGYCIGGTLLALTLAWLAARGDGRFGSATFMVSLQDFSKVGDTAVFISELTIDFIEQQMLERGYLDSREMANMFNLLRANDLIWANVVNNYLMGNKPPAFDLLYWNSDGTRMAGAAHGWYLRNTYLENNLIKPGKIRLKGEAIDLGRIQAGRLRGRRREGSYRAVGRRLAHHPALRRHRAFRAGLQRSYRGDRQSAGRQGGLLGHGARPARPAGPRNGSRRRPATTEAGGRTGRLGCPSGPAAWSIRRRSAATPIRRWAMRPAAMYWRNNSVVVWRPGG